MKKSESVTFGSAKLMGFLGVIIGGIIAIGIPWILLNASIDCGRFLIGLLSILGIVGGVALAITAVFFSIVIPSKVEESN